VELILSPIRAPIADALPVEITERKGLGHPDTICDAIAEHFSLALCRHYLERFGRVLHHNVDKVLLRGGSARAEYGGGEVLAPIEIYLAGRATAEVGGAVVPVEALAVESARDWIRQHIRALDPERHLKVRCLVRPGSADLTELFLRRAADQVPLANDTVVAVGFAPLSDLERAVIAVERHLNSPGVKAASPEIGEDVKVLGIRRGEGIHLTVAAAFVARHLSSLPRYLERKAHATRLALEAAGAATGRKLTAQLNVADDPASGSVYLTVTGTSAEAGDDGQAGRGNRANGLITPYRPMAVESMAGKNPVTHVGKLYQIGAHRIARSIVGEVEAVEAAQCYLASQIGRPISDPRMVDLQLALRKRTRMPAIERQVRAIVRRALDGLPDLWREAVEGKFREV
jgi:S-adenosylmethionine synthetase